MNVPYLYICFKFQFLHKQTVEVLQKEINDLITDYQNMGQEAQALEKGMNDPTLTQTARDDKKKALDAKKQDLLNLQNKIQEMSTERKRELDDELLRRHKEILDEISAIINGYSGPQGYDLVLDKSPKSSTSSVSIVLYNSSKLTDITDDIIKLLNKNAPAGSATSASSVPSGTAAPLTPATPATSPQ